LLQQQKASYHNSSSYLTYPAKESNSLKQISRMVIHIFLMQSEVQPG
jgi:hypothetical protein